MKSCRAIFVAALSVACFAGAAQAAETAYSKLVQKNCKADYKKFCGDYGLETAALRLPFYRAVRRMEEAALPRFAPSWAKPPVSLTRVAEQRLDLDHANRLEHVPIDTRGPLFVGVRGIAAECENPSALQSRTVAQLTRHFIAVDFGHR